MPLWSLNHEIVEQQQAFTESRSESPLCLKNHLQKNTVSRPVHASTYIPRFSENDYVANGWIKSEPDVISLAPATNEEDASPKSHNRAWSTHSTRTQPPYVSNLGVSLLTFVF